MTTVATISKHTHQVVFGRRVDGCPRCAQLNNGAPPVKWSGTLRREEEARRIAEIRAHRCSVSGCGPVCTFGEW